MDHAAQPDSQRKTVFPPLPSQRRKRFNKHIIIPSALALAVCIVVVTLVVCYGTFSDV